MPAHIATQVKRQPIQTRGVEEKMPLTRMDKLKPDTPGLNTISQSVQKIFSSHITTGANIYSSHTTPLPSHIRDNMVMTTKPEKGANLFHTFPLPQKLPKIVSPNPILLGAYVPLLWRQPTDTPRSPIGYLIGPNHTLLSLGPLLPYGHVSLLLQSPLCAVPPILLTPVFFRFLILCTLQNAAFHRTMTMDARGGCCIARYATGAYDMSKVHRIMLRFRPIAPKPVTGSTNSGGSSSESSDAFSKQGGRPKRKYVRDNSNKNKRCNRRRKSPPPPTEPEPEPVVTLPLLPETPDRKDPAASVRNHANHVPIWLSFENCAAGKVDPATSFWRGGGSCVTVECVTGTWAEGDVLGSTDEERRVKLSRDTCPGFISDGYGRVTWTNGAYGKMVGEGKERVWLVMKEEKVGRMMGAYTTSFTCRVRLEYYNNNTCGNKKRRSVTVPCDVWRMESGGFAWRLDVNAALSLSLPP
ncbi:uncharacterized protein G2W53_008811 [Senna tora]|uniref:DUF7950 domain-containing protein n=1 Tax=Senna tora TaxID=362788 RepID=A0A834WXE1_9FABA|nr:uncharacterized protein G2W53_008811 [Senna tora]